MVCSIDDIGALFSENLTVAVSAAPTVDPTESPNARRYDRACYGDDDCRRSEVCDDGFCAEPGNSGSDDSSESGCCVVMEEWSSSKRWPSKCAEAADSKTCLRFGQGTTTRCDWRSGEDADCSPRYGPPSEPPANGECVWSGEGRGDSDRMNRKCSRLDLVECAESRNCEWSGYEVGDDEEEQNGNVFLIDIAWSHSIQSGQIGFTQFRGIIC